MTEHIEIEEDWNFYPWQANGHPASFNINLALRKLAPLRSHPVLYRISLEILDPGDHGMGTGDDVQSIWDTEDQITPAAQELSLISTGTIRSQGKWQLCYYGPSGAKQKLEAITKDAVARHGKRRFAVGTKDDPGWEVYLKFLFPNPERYQWILDQRVCMNLENSGDNNDAPRPVDHFLYFPDADTRKSVIREAKRLGFKVKAKDNNANPPRPCSLHLVRKDPVELEHIHAVVMQLTQLADANSGEYDGWGCPVVG